MFILSSPFTLICIEEWKKEVKQKKQRTKNTDIFYLYFTYIHRLFNSWSRSLNLDWLKVKKILSCTTSSVRKRKLIVSGKASNHRNSGTLNINYLNKYSSIRKQRKKRTKYLGHLTRGKNTIYFLPLPLNKKGRQQPNDFPN